MTGAHVTAASEVAHLLSARAVREQAEAMLALAEGGELERFTLDWTRLPAIVDRVLATTRATYPDLTAIPPHSRWRQFAAGGIDRAAELERQLARGSRQEALRARFDLVVTSVLLDAGAGARWCFVEPGTGLVLGRSEGLAVASFHMFLAGGFSSLPQSAPLRADALEALDEQTLGRFFQVGPENPMVGLAGRVALLRRLAAALRGSGGDPRVGTLADRLQERAAGGVLPAEMILSVVLETLGPIWPGRQILAGVNLGDTWPHPRLGLVPFHKLSQWLTYSLIEPLEAAGLRIVDPGALTGLAEYRNGGLFVDGGLLLPRAAAGPHPVGSPLVVEWRALTVALLDRVAVELRRRLGLDALALPLASVLEGGTWRAGREIAAELRADGGPPLQVESDGTVF
jgi:Protein of unknown function (DUF1688)